MLPHRIGHKCVVDGYARVFLKRTWRSSTLKCGPTWYCSRSIAMVHPIQNDHSQINKDGCGDLACAFYNKRHSEAGGINARPQIRVSNVELGASSQTTGSAHAPSARTMRPTKRGSVAVRNYGQIKWPCTEANKMSLTDFSTMACLSA